MKPVPLFDPIPFHETTYQESPQYQRVLSYLREEAPFQLLQQIWDEKASHEKGMTGRYSGSIHSLAHSWWIWPEGTELYTISQFLRSLPKYCPFQARLTEDKQAYGVWDRRSQKEVSYHFTYESDARDEAGRRNEDYQKMRQFHTDDCWDAIEVQQAAIDAWKRQWPLHCQICHGEGGKSSSFDPSPAGVSLSPGSFYGFDPCESCVSWGRCPRCGHGDVGVGIPEKSDPEPLETCPECGWTQTPECMPPQPAECTCFGVNEEGDLH